jgi:hypothetical protein
MKRTSYVSIVIGLVLALSPAGLAASTVASVSADNSAVSASGQKSGLPASGDNTQAPSSGETKSPSADQQSMRGLDEQVQDTKTDVLKIAAELNQLEEKLLYPSGTQVAVFVALAKGNPMRLDSVRLRIDGNLVAQYIYSAKELEALRKGGVQRIYVGNVATGDHQLEALVEGKTKDGKDFSRMDHFTIRKEVKPKLVELTMAGPGSGNAPIALGEW